jgi:hypothetical protein
LSRATSRRTNKIRDATTGVLVTVKSKSPIWHMYYAPVIGASLYGMEFPPYLKVLTPKGTYLQLKYIMRPKPRIDGEQQNGDL